MSLIKAQAPRAGCTNIVGPGKAGLDYIGFGLINLSAGESWKDTLADREAVLVVLGGRCDVEVGGQAWKEIGQRADVFSGRPTAVYLPPGSSVSVTGNPAAEIALCSALADTGPEPTLIPPDDVGVRQVGSDTYRREIHDIITADSFPAQRLLVGETFNPAGLWSSYPPHKHDVHQPPEESKLEEVYHFRLQPPEGFGIQRVYGEGFDASYAIQHGDTVAIAQGFHPVVAAPGYRLYYLWILAGQERVMIPRDDPAHAWVTRQS